MAVKEVPVPDIGDFDTVDVVEVLVKAGDTVAVEDSLISLESDKATMEIPSPFAGVVKEVKVKVGDKVSEGMTILSVESEDSGKDVDEDDDQSPSDSDEAAEEASERSADEESGDDEEGDDRSRESLSGNADTESEPEAESDPEDKADPKKSAASEHKKTEAQTPSDDSKERKETKESPKEKPHASPSVRLFARELGADLSRINGSGRKGRILKEDVQQFVKAALKDNGKKGFAGFDFPERPSVDFSKFGEIERVELSRIRKISGAHLHRNWVSIPHVTQFDEADITELEAFRKSQIEEMADGEVKLTLLAFIIKACAASLREFPRANSSLDADGEHLILKHYCHIGVAVDTDDGLVVPVVRDVDKKGLVEIAREVVELAAKAKAKRLAPRDIQGATFSVSSLGGLGGTAFTPIINAPEVAVLGVSRAVTKPVYQEGEFRPRLILPLSLSYDHRVIDGAEAVRFTSALSADLADVRRILL